MKLYVVWCHYRMGLSIKPHDKIFFSYEAAEDCGKKLAEQYNEIYQKTFDKLPDIMEMKYEICEVELVL